MLSSLILIHIAKTKFKPSEKYGYIIQLHFHKSFNCVITDLHLCTLYDLLYPMYYVYRAMIGVVGACITAFILVCAAVGYLGKSSYITDLVSIHVSLNYLDISSYNLNHRCNYRF